MRENIIALTLGVLIASALVAGCAPSTHSLSETGGNAAAAAADWPLRNEMHAANNMQCSSCHDEEDPTQGVAPVSADKCLSCHGSREEVAARTAEVGEDINPHDNFHYDQGLDCTTCHKTHTDSVNLCASCHDTDLWTNDIP